MTRSTLQPPHRKPPLNSQLSSLSSPDLSPTPLLYCTRVFPGPFARGSCPRADNVIPGGKHYLACVHVRPLSGKPEGGVAASTLNLRFKGQARSGGPGSTLSFSSRSDHINAPDRFRPAHDRSLAAAIAPPVPTATPITDSRATPPGQPSFRPPAGSGIGPSPCPPPGAVSG